MEGTPGSRLVAGALLTTPVLGFVLPFYGLFASLLALWAAVPRAQAVLWTRRTSRRWSIVLLGTAALWLLPVLSFAGLLHALLGDEPGNAVGTARWLLLPLCGPADVVTPAVVAFAVHALGTAASALVRRPWPWLLGGVAATLAYDLTMHLRAVDFIC